jgi:hypothetical protein
MLAEYGKENNHVLGVTHKEQVVLDFKDTVILWYFLPYGTKCFPHPF